MRNKYKVQEEGIMRKMLPNVVITLTVFAGFLLSLAAPAWSAGDVDLGAGLKPKEGAQKTAKDQFKRKAPWKIALSLPGMGNTWLVQMLEESKYEASKHKQIAQFIVADAEWKPDKQVADLEDMLTKNVDAIIVYPVTPTSLGPIIEKIATKGIPTITAGPVTGTDKLTSFLEFGREPFGRVGGEFLAKELKGKGTVWMIRGVAGVAEEEFRYQGAVSAFKGTNIKIGAEVYADWSYAKGKQVCENLVLSGKPVDGIWFSGAEMTKGCVEVFQEFKKPLVPMTGESNNGYLRLWKAVGLKSAAPEYPPSIGEAQVLAAVSLLEGKRIYRDYVSVLPGITNQNFDRFYRPDLNDNYWMPSGLPEAKLKELYGKK
jgi:ribose transport system substrate-binding protein